MAERHILLVDDEPNLQESMKIGLELRGYDVSVASNGSQAIKECQQHLFDAVLLGENSASTELSHSLSEKTPGQIQTSRNFPF